MTFERFGKIANDRLPGFAGAFVLLMRKIGFAKEQATVDNRTTFEVPGFRGLKALHDLGVFGLRVLQEVDGQVGLFLKKLLRKAGQGGKKAPAIAGTGKPRLPRWPGCLTRFCASYTLSADGGP